jgi:predicted enzyme related to lactoylglutathione lyase
MEALREHAEWVCQRFAGRYALLLNDLQPKRRFVMGEPAQHHSINYIEFFTTDMDRAKSFYSSVFGWKFQDYGPDYASFSRESAGIDGGFRKRTENAHSGTEAPLIVIYSRDLKATEAAVIAAGGTIVVPTFEFPGGRRFHFSDGAGNVLAVWSD